LLYAPWVRASAGRLEHRDQVFAPLFWWSVASLLARSSTDAHVQGQSTGVNLA
jgi:hypothetical protein